MSSTELGSVSMDLGLPAALRLAGKVIVVVDVIWKLVDRAVHRHSAPRTKGHSTGAVICSALGVIAANVVIGFMRGTELCLAGTAFAIAGTKDTTLDLTTLAHLLPRADFSAIRDVGAWGPGMWDSDAHIEFSHADNGEPNF